MLTGILCIFDTLKHEMELELMVGSVKEQEQIVQDFCKEVYSRYPSPNGGK